MKKHLLLIMLTLLTEAAAGPTNVVNAAGKVAFLQSKANSLRRKK